MSKIERDWRQQSSRSMYCRKYSTLSGPMVNLEYYPMNPEREYEILEPQSIRYFDSEDRTDRSTRSSFRRRSSRRMSLAYLPSEYQDKDQELIAVDSSNLNKQKSRSLTFDEFNKVLIMPKGDSLHNSARDGRAQTNSVVTGIPCPLPTEFLKEVDRTDGGDQGPVLLRTLKKQKKEASKLAEEHRSLKSAELAKELSKLADRAAYSIALFNRRQQYRKPIPYRFEWVSLPQANINASVPVDVLDACLIHGSDYVRPVDASTTLATLIQLDLFYPSRSKKQRIRSHWVKNPGESVYYATDMRFHVNSNAVTYADFLRTTHQLQATILYNRGSTKKPGLIGVAKFSIGDLLNKATVNVAGNLIDDAGHVNGHLELQLQQHSPANGQAFDMVRKPWLFLAVPEIPSFDSKLLQEIRLKNTNSRQNVEDLNKEKIVNGAVKPSKPVQQSRPLSPSQVIDVLETDLSSEKGTNIRLAEITDLMDKVHQQWQPTTDARRVMSYRANLTILLRLFHQKRDEAEKQDDAKKARYYTRRIKLIFNELRRYEIDADSLEEKKPGNLQSNQRKTDNLDRPAQPSSTKEDIPTGSNSILGNVEPDLRKNVRSQNKIVDKSPTFAYAPAKITNSNGRVINISVQSQMEPVTEAATKSQSDEEGKEELIIYV